MDKLLDYNLRQGKVVNIKTTLEELEATYIGCLDASIDSYDEHEEISSETYNDLITMKTQLSLLEMLGYIDKEEADNMRSYADELRLRKLGEIENKKEGEN